MCVGHAANSCRSGSVAKGRRMEWGLAAGRPRSSVALLDCRPPPPNGLGPVSCVALGVFVCPPPGDLSVFLSGGLAARLGGGGRLDYKVAPTASQGVAVFFPNWVARESAIARSPLLLENHRFRFLNWVEPGEVGRGRLLHKVWIKLHLWPVCCWYIDDVRAVSRPGGRNRDPGSPTDPPPMQNPA